MDHSQPKFNSPKHPNVEASVSYAQERVEESSWVAAMAKGDTTALDKLYQRLSPIVQSLAVRMLGSLSEAEEVMQDAFVKMWQKARVYDSTKSPVVSWALMITRGLALDRLRKQGRRSQQPVLGLVDTQLAPDGLDPVRFVQLQEAIAQLNPQERECLEQSIFDDLSHPEIAAASGEPLGTIKSRLRRTLLKLRHLMDAQS